MSGTVIPSPFGGTVMAGEMTILGQCLRGPFCLGGRQGGPRKPGWTDGMIVSALGSSWHRSELRKPDLGAIFGFSDLVGVEEPPREGWPWQAAYISYISGTCCLAMGLFQQNLGFELLAETGPLGGCKNVPFVEEGGGAAAGGS